MATTPAESCATVAAVLLMLIIAVQIPKGECLSCVQCQGEVRRNSDGTLLPMDDHSEPSNYSCVALPPPPMPCTDNMDYCLTVTTYQPSRGVMTVIRSCAPADMAWDCEVGPASTGLPVQVCHNTCRGHGCNRGLLRQPGTTTLMMATATVFLSVLSTNKF